LEAFHFTFREDPRRWEKIGRFLFSYVLAFLSSLWGWAPAANLFNMLRKVVLKATKQVLHNYLEDTSTDIVTHVLDLGWSIIFFLSRYILVLLAIIFIVIVANHVIVRIRTGKWIILAHRVFYYVHTLHPKQDLPDHRPKAMKQDESTHKDPLYADVRFVDADVGIFYHRVHTSINKVSMELFSQLAVPNILVPGRDEGLVWLSLQHAAARTGFINISRQDVFDRKLDGQYGEDVYGNTAFMVMGFYRCLRQRSATQAFHTTP